MLKKTYSQICRGRHTLTFPYVDYLISNRASDKIYNFDKVTF